MKQKLIATACALCLAVCLTIPAVAANFSDVSEKTWYAAAVNEASEKGYMAGTGHGLFSPTASVTRATAVTVLWRMEGTPIADKSADFSDIAPGTWCADAVSWAQSVGITSGDDKGRFQPDAAVTREQLASFLYNYAKYKNHTLTSGVLELYYDSGNISKWAVPAMEHAVGAGLLKGSGAEIIPKGSASRAELAVVLQRLETPVVG